jgi:hypothetical protein
MHPNGYPPNGDPHTDNSAIRPVRIDTSTNWAPQLSNFLNANYPQSAYENSGRHLSFPSQKSDIGVTGMIDKTASIELTQRPKYHFNPITGKKKFLEKF